MMLPETRYAKSGDVNIAYQVTGSGPLDLLLVPGYVSNLDLFWEEPSCARWLDRLGRFSRLIRFDKRGTGLSDRTTDMPTLEVRMDDVRAVMDAVGSKRAALAGYSEGGSMSMLFAATYPDRVSALIMQGCFACWTWAPDHPWAPTAEQHAARIERVENEWGDRLAWSSATRAWRTTRAIANGGQGGCAPARARLQPQPCGA